MINSRTEGPAIDNAGPSREITALPSSAEEATVCAVTGGALDDDFIAFKYCEARAGGPVFWLKLEPTVGYSGGSVPFIVQEARAGRVICADTAFQPLLVRT